MVKEALTEFLSTKKEDFPYPLLNTTLYQSEAPTKA
jgi:hypothetical protein